MCIATRLVQFPSVDLKNDSITKEDGIGTGGKDVMTFITSSTSEWCIIPNYNGVQTLCCNVEVGVPQKTIETNSSTTLYGEEIPVIDTSNQPLSIRLFGGRPRPPKVD